MTIEDRQFWTFLLNEKLDQYIPLLDSFWESWESYDMTRPGVFALSGATDPPGLSIRVCRTRKRSTIPGLQVFTFLPTSFLQIPVKAPGGFVKLIEKLCINDTYIHGGYSCIERHGLPSLYNQGQVLVLVPTTILNKINDVGAWIFLTPFEMASLVKTENVHKTIKDKLLLKL